MCQGPRTTTYTLMGQTESPPQRRRVVWAVWIAVLVVWSLLLETPGNWFPGWRGPKPAGVIDPFGKSLHIAAYFALAASAGWLPTSRLIRTEIVLLLILHG